MKQNLTHLVVVSDRSGSMYSSAREAEGAINRMIEDQKKEEGECHLTFVEFDDQYDVVHNGVDIQSVDKYELIPRGWTALYDAVGTAITTVGEKLANTPEDERPALVTVIISTDGLENHSTEYSGKQIADLIKQQKEQYNWKFVFLGVEIDAENIAKDLNIDVNSAVRLSRNKSDSAYDMTSKKMSAMRSAVNSGTAASDVAMCYSAKEKESLQ